MPTDIELILCTCPDRATSEKIAKRLIESRAAACVNILPGLTSVYSWQDRLETAEEHLLLVKSTRDCYPAVERAIRELHPYELPEIVALPVGQGLPAYLNWIAATCAVIE